MNDNNGIFKYACDIDAYKINMMQVIFEKYPEKEVEYDFKCRSRENIYHLLAQIREEILRLENVKFTQMDLEKLSRKKYLKPAFIESLRDFRFDPLRHVNFSKDVNGQLKITVKGAWYKTILYETIILAIISEVRNRVLFPEITIDMIREQLFKKVEKLKSEVKRRNLEGYFKFMDFGTRRRFSYESQFLVVDYLHKEVPEMFVGTSNIHIAHELGIPSMGTMAHEMLCAHQAIVNPRDSVRKTLEVWNEVFKGNLGIALTDAINTDSFIKDFDLGMAKLFDGVRHDSGCPFEWGDKFIAHYEKLGIDPMTKILVFSDGLDFNKALDLAEYFKDRIKFSFGIGTFLSNDVGDYVNANGVKYTPLSIVMKLMLFDGLPVAKISDEPVKSMSRSAAYLTYLMEIFNIEVSKEVIDKAVVK